MKSRQFPIGITILILSFSIAKSAQAGFFYGGHLIDDPRDSFDDNPWIYFGGCENQEETACNSDADDTDFDHYNTLLIGDYDVKQGLYQVSEPNDDHLHGKLILTYFYRFLTEEGKDNSTDVGYIKLKDVETDTIYYLATLTPKDQTTDWQYVRFGLPIELVNRPLQLVVEVENDGERISRLGIDNIYLTHASEPVIRGTVYGPKRAGKQSVLDGVTIKLQNRSRTKTYAETTTVVQSDAPDTYTFWPVARRKKFTIVATYRGQEQTLHIRKLMWGSYRADEDFYFD